jgi:hypothetical protein
MEPIRTDGQSSLFEFRQMNASRAKIMWSQVTKYFLNGTLSRASSMWATIICSPPLANFPAPDSAVFSAEKTCFRLHKREKDWSSPVFLKSRVCDPTETASTLIALDSKFFRQSGMLRILYLCSHKSLNILLQVFAKYVSARDPSSAIRLLANYACAFTNRTKAKKFAF